MDGESGPFLRESASVNGPWTAAESKALWTTTAMYRNGTDLFVVAQLPFSCTSCPPWGATAATAADSGIYYRGADGTGQTWTQRFSALALGVITPLRQVAALAVSSPDAIFISSDGFATAPASVAGPSAPSRTASIVSVVSVDDASGQEQLLIGTEASSLPHLSSR